uniref:FYVE-type domain-containing protein n=1 Tax=Acrobeloides nanus TaxID=290746 RepID=A0A914DFK9_9BILA
MHELRQNKKTNVESRQKLATIRQQNSIESPDVENKSILEAPTPTSSKNFVPGRYEAVWIPDNKATKCLMAGCDTKFSMIQRKHHCRQCGWLICDRCVGTAPVKIKNYDSVKVCPQCYYEIKDLFEKGVLFPSHMIRILGLSENSESSQDFSRLSIDSSNIRIAYEDGSSLEKPKDLFRAPDSGKLMKIKNPLEKDGTEEYIVSGKVQLRTKKGYEINRWGRFSRDYNLDFFEAEFDDSPAEKFFVYGYTLSVVENEDGSHVFELLHRNQFQTDRKEEKIIFKVLHSGSAAKWLDTLKDMLIYDG